MWVSLSLVGNFMNNVMSRLSSVMKIRKLIFRYDLFYVRILLDAVYHRYRGVSLQFWVLAPNSIVQEKMELQMQVSMCCVLP